jgi:translation initiation factor eIF-2B subunit delta
MATGADDPPVEAKPKSSEKPQNTPAIPKAESQTKVENAAPPAAPKLSNAELKAKAKAEKQARRAQVKASKEATQGGPAAPVMAGPSTADTKGNKAKGKPDSTPSTALGATGRTAGSKGPVPPTVAPKPEIALPECFSHLSLAKRLPITQADKDVHPTVLTLGQQMATFAIDESITRLKATLLAFKKVRSLYPVSICRVWL